MWKAIVAGTAALAIAGTSLVYAQQRGRMEGGERWRPNTEDLRAFGEARLAALKAGLMLTPEQEKNWPAFEQAARDFGKLRLERMSAMRNAAPTDDPVERLRQRATALSDTGAALKKLAEATDPLYKSLDENQKRRFQVLNRLAGPGARGRGGSIAGNISVNASAGARVVAGSTGVRSERTGILEKWSTLAQNVFNCHITRGNPFQGQRRRSHSQPPDTIADVREPPGPHPAAFLLGAVMLRRERALASEPRSMAARSAAALSARAAERCSDALSRHACACRSLA